MSPEVIKYAYRGIIDYLGGRQEEYERLIKMAMEFNEVEPANVKCLYKVGGQKIKAFINFSTATITDTGGNILRRGSKHVSG